MAGFSVANNEHLIRSNTWDTQLKRVLEDDLMGMSHVRMIPYWGGGPINIPSLGQFLSRDYTEGQQVMYDAADTGNFTFTPVQYKSAATFITNKMKQDTFYMNELMSAFVPGHARAIAIDMEVSLFRAPTPAAITGTGQTTANTNTINTAEHRWIGKGTNETMSMLDFPKINYALNMGMVPFTGRIGIVDPSVAHALETQTNIVNGLSPIWGPIAKTGIRTGMRFITTIYGIDIYVSNYLYKNTSSETIGGVTAAAGVNNLFFSTDSSCVPFVGTVMQAPKVDSNYNHNYQREEFVTTARFDHAFFRPENMVIVVTDTDQVT